MKTLLNFIIVILITFSATAQDKRPTSSNIEALSIAFITGKLNLTPDEAQKFWPIWNSYQREMNSLFDQKRKNHETNKDLEVAYNTDLQLDAKLFFTKRRFFQKDFPQVISAQKVAALYNSEREFRESLYKRLGDGDKKDGGRR